MPDPDGLTRLWTPYRMAYVRSDTTADGCPFCRIPQDDEETSLVVARGETTYAVLNLHPYNPGHLMVLPYRHVADLEDLTDAESAELMAMTQRAIRAIRSVSDPHAFQHRDQPRRPRGRLSGRPPAPARGPAVVRRRRTSSPSSVAPRRCRSCWRTPAGCSPTPGATSPLTDPWTPLAPVRRGEERGEGRWHHRGATPGVRRCTVMYARSTSITGDAGQVDRVSRSCATR